MNELSLFSGAGGGLLGTKLLGWSHIGYVEINDYCQRIIKQRINDGILNAAPIFGDIQAFIDQGYADGYSRMVDVITAGFPCQPFSVAGKQQGENDERNMWPATIDVIRRVRPRHLFLENVPGLLAHPYAKRIFGDLAESGFDVRWRVLSAAEVGAPHKRDRLWIVAHSNGARRESKQITRHWRENTSKPGDDGKKESMADAAGVPLQKLSRPAQARIWKPRGRNRNSAPRIDWWAVEPRMGRVANGVPDRTLRLKALGNGQVPAVVATAWRLLNSEKETI